MTNRKATMRNRRWIWIAALLALALVAGAWTVREDVTGYAKVASAYSARVACSCRFVAGRDLDQCADDRMAGMELVTLAENAEMKSVTARFPLISSDTAYYREGFGCVMEEWEG